MDRGLILFFVLVFVGIVQAQLEYANFDPISVDEKIQSLDSQIKVNEQNQSFVQLAEKMRSIYNSSKSSGLLYTQGDLSASGGLLTNAIPNDIRVVPADDFEVPVNQQWTITEIFGGGNLNNDPLEEILIEFYDDISGSPNNLIQSDSVLINDIIEVNGDLMIDVSDITLTPGTYWIVISHISRGSLVNWLWAISIEPPIGNFVHFQNTAIRQEWISSENLAPLNGQFNVAFSLFGIIEDFPPDSAPIPTLGEWSIAMLGGLLLIFGIVFLKARRSTIVGST